MKYEYRSGIPLPDINNRVCSTCEFPFEDMQPGDSVMIDWQDYAAAKSQSQRIGKKRGNVKFVSRILEHGYGFWCEGDIDGITTHHA